MCCILGYRKVTKKILLTALTPERPASGHYQLVDIYSRPSGVGSTFSRNTGNTDETGERRSST